MTPSFKVNKEKLETVMTGIFNVPKELVWKGFTDPKLVPQWWGPRGITTKVETIDVKVGGTWRYVQIGEDGEYAFNGEYKEVEEPNKLVYTFEFEPMAGHVSLETITLETVDGNKTLVTDTLKFANIEDLEGMVGSGMEGGATESFDRLGEVLNNLQQ